MYLYHRTSTIPVQVQWFKMCSLCSWEYQQTYERFASGIQIMDNSLYPPSRCSEQGSTFLGLTNGSQRNLLEFQQSSSLGHWEQCEHIQRCSCKIKKKARCIWLIKTNSFYSNPFLVFRQLSGLFCESTADIFVGGITNCQRCKPAE